MPVSDEQRSDPAAPAKSEGTGESERIGERERTGDSEETGAGAASSTAAPAPLHETLLRAGAVASERSPTRRWAYPLWGILLVSCFVFYHASVLLVWNSPGKGLTKDWHKSYLEKVKGYPYFRGTRNSQSWAMFAPNPNRTNSFIRVFVEDQNGQLWDFEQDIWGIDRYPYFFYDRRGKVNRRIDNKKHYQRIYGAWVCREWERRHGGEAAKSVTFIKRYTRVPKPDVVIKKGGWDQWKAPYRQKEQETITCKTVVDGQLSNELRARYGLPEVDEDSLRRPKQRTWWDQQEAERRRIERQADRELAQAEARDRRLGQDRDKARTSDQTRTRELTGSSAPIDARGPVRDEVGEPSEDEVDH